MKHSDTLASRTLLAMARQRHGLDEPRCVAVFDLTASGAAAGAALHDALARHHLSDLQFDLLVVLFALAPRPVAPADLAHYTGFSRTSVSGAVGELQRRQCLTTERTLLDRRSVDVRLTEAGRRLAESAATDYLRTLGTLAGRFKTVEPVLLRQLRERFCATTPDPVAPLSASRTS